MKTKMNLHRTEPNRKSNKGNSSFKINWYIGMYLRNAVAGYISVIQYMENIIYYKTI